MLDRLIGEEITEQELNREVLTEVAKVLVAISETNDLTYYFSGNDLEYKFFKLVFKKVDEIMQILGYKLCLHESDPDPVDDIGILIAYKDYPKL